MTFLQKYREWVESDIIDEDTKKELEAIKENSEIEDRFYKDLEFGTGGLRGVIGAGTNRMNIYTVGKATQGFSDYINSKDTKNKSVAIAYDSRIKSKDFAEAAAETLCANGIKVYLFESLRPTPMLSFTVRHLNCQGGIVITASHNPKQYNGYKVYGEDGGQVTDKNAKEIISYVDKINDFKNVKRISLESAKENSLLKIIGEDVDSLYIEKVKDLTIRKELVQDHAKDIKIIYTPIHGSGNIPVRTVLKELGYDNVFVVKEQEHPDGMFPTANYPNPEEPQVFDLALKMAEEVKPDIIFGTDPDCDRIGVVVKDGSGEFKVLTGNQTGALLTNYILTSLNDLGKLTEKATIIKTIVTTEFARKITENFNVKIIDVLTGFKYIGEKIKEFNETGSNDFIFGFEESYGYLAGSFVRDKDAVIAATLISEMTLYYKSKGMSLYDALTELYNKYGFYKEELVSVVLEGREGQEKIKNALQYLRTSMKSDISGKNIIKQMDYKSGIEKDIINNKENVIDLPKSNVLKFVLEDGSWFVIRPSGTEPKMKIYLSVIGEDLDDASSKMENFKNEVMSIVNEACDL